MTTHETGCILATAGEAIAGGAGCYISAGLGGLTAGRAYHTSSALAYSSALADLVGVATAPASGPGERVRLRMLGVQDGYVGLSVGHLQYLAIDGAISETASGNCRPIGMAISETEIQVASTSPAGGSSEVAITPTLTGVATAYTGQTLTLTVSNWASFGANRVAWCQLVDSAGAVATAATDTTDNGDGTITVPLPAEVGTYSAQVRCSQFGSAPSKTTEHEITLSALPAFRYYRLTGFIGTNPSAQYWRLFTGVGPGKGTLQAYPFPEDGQGNNGTQYPASYLTAPALPSPYVMSASFEYSATYAAWKACDNTSGMWWALGHGTVDSLADWLQIDLGAPVAIQSSWFRFYNTSISGVRLEGSNDALAWTTMSEATSITYTGTWIM